jgi:(2Fe-2S) ferredoxin
MSLPQKVKNIRFHEESLADKVCKSGPNLMFHSDSINWYQYFENADKEEKVKKEERVENNTI